MNYFGHAAIAIKKESSSAFILGAMLPDLLSMIGVKNAGFELPEIQEGINFHLKTDALFHDTQTFITWNRQTLAKLRAKNVGRGPARASAHIGVEMLIDAELMKEEGLFQPYLDALAWGSKNDAAFAPQSDLITSRLQGLCSHLEERGDALFVRTEKRFFDRFDRILSERPLLAASKLELRIIAQTLADDVSGPERVPALLDELSLLFEGS